LSGQARLAPVSVAERARQRQIGPTLPGPPSTNGRIGQRKDKSPKTGREQGWFLMPAPVRQVRRGSVEPEYRRLAAGRPPQVSGNVRLHDPAPPASWPSSRLHGPISMNGMYLCCKSWRPRFQNLAGNFGTAWTWPGGHRNRVRHGICGMCIIGLCATGASAWRAEQDWPVPFFPATERAGHTQGFPKLPRHLSTLPFLPNTYKNYSRCPPCCSWQRQHRLIDCSRRATHPTRSSPLHSSAHSSHTGTGPCPLPGIQKAEQSQVVLPVPRALMELLFGLAQPLLDVAGPAVGSALVGSDVYHLLFASPAISNRYIFLQGE
jgi:hypothetical protein